MNGPIWQNKIKAKLYRYTLIFRIKRLHCKNKIDLKLTYSAYYYVVLAIYQWLAMVTLCIFFCSMSFIKVDQEFVVETDTTVKYVMGETGANKAFISNNNKRSITLVDAKIKLLVRIFFPQLKGFQTYSS